MKATFRILTPRHMVPIEQLKDLDNILEVEVRNPTSGYKTKMTMHQCKMKYLSSPKTKSSPGAPGSRPGEKP